MNAVVITLIILLIISVIVNYRYWNQYVYVPEYPCKYYLDIQFKSGDILLFKSLTSTHAWISGEPFTHVGIVLKYKGVLHCLEIQEPNVKFTPLFHRLFVTNDGYMYYKSINREVQLDDAAVDNMLDWAREQKFGMSDTYMWMNRFYACSRDNYWYKPYKYECAMFVLHCMWRMGILSGKEKPGCLLVKWLSELTKCNADYAYADLRQISFFDDACYWVRSDFWEIPGSYIRRLF